jgi:hypothetical protein
VTWIVPSGRLIVPSFAGPFGTTPAATVSGRQIAVQPLASVQMNRPCFSALRL